MNKNLQSGLTLVELMVVVAVIGIISAIAMPIYNGYIRTSHLKEVRVALNSLEIAEEESRSSTGTYFEGGDTATLITKSSGLWDINKPELNAAQNETARNFTYKVDPGTPGITTSYTATATGKASSGANGIICTLNNGEDVTCN